MNDMPLPAARDKFQRRHRHAAPRILWYLTDYHLPQRPPPLRSLSLASLRRNSPRRPPRLWLRSATPPARIPLQSGLVDLPMPTALPAGGSRLTGERRAVSGNRRQSSSRAASARWRSLRRYVDVRRCQLNRLRSAPLRSGGTVRASRSGVIR